jgi:hypothetical protein
MADSNKVDESKTPETSKQIPVSTKRTRLTRAFPAGPVSESLEFAKQVYEVGSGNPVRRITLFDEIKKSPDSGASRQLIINSNKYGFTKGAYNAEQIELTAEGLIAVADNTSSRERTRALVKLGVLDIDLFKNLYEKLVSNKLPARAALIDMAKSIGVENDLSEEFIDTFIVNLRHLGLLTVLAGADRVISVDHLLDSVPAEELRQNPSPVLPAASRQNLITTADAHYEKCCFYISPIGDEGTAQRLHSDLFLESIVQPALEQFKLEVVRADKIDKTGFITKQIIEYLIKSRLVIADLSFHNPNVFYELAIRHAIRKPIVQIIQKGDKIPFDVNQSRTIIIDNSSIYSLVPTIDAYRSEIATQVRSALENPESTDTPLSLFYPSFSVNI